MRTVLGRVTGLALVSMGACVASCSAHREPEAERIASTRLAMHGPVVAQSTRRVCQLIGDTDYQTGQPTISKTQTRFGVGFTDLGYPVARRGRTYFFFGDESTQNDVDPLGFTDEKPTNGKCPKLEFSVANGSASAQAVTLDGSVLSTGGDGFNVPTGVVYDPAGDRFIAHFVLRLSGRAPQAVFAEAKVSDDAPIPKHFMTIAGGRTDPTRFAQVAPWIVDASEVKDIPLPGTGSKVLLAWGTGQPTPDGYRTTGVFLSAIRLEELDLGHRSSWRFFNGGPTRWSANSADAVEVASKGNAGGEISVSFDPSLKEWRLVHATTSNWLSAGEISEDEGGGFPPGEDPRIRGVVVMRTASQPEGPWSEAKLLFRPKKNGLPVWGDEGSGLFFHEANQRGYYSSLGGPLLPILGDGQTRPLEPLGATCATSFPSYCPGRLVQDPFNPAIGCCTRPDACCDFAFDQIGWTGAAPHFSWGGGTIYAPYLIPSFTQDTKSDPSARFPDRQRVFWTGSTLNPYVVVLMSTDLQYGDLDHDGVPNDKDNCPLTFNPDQANCNFDAEDALAKRNGSTPVHLGDVCDPVPCPKAQMDVVDETGACREGSKYSVTGCFGRRIRDRIDFTPVGAGIHEDLLLGPITGPPPNVRVDGVVTHARFCQENKELEVPFDCGNAAIMRDEQLNLWTSADAERPLPDRPWHRITLARKVCRKLGGQITCTSVAEEASPRGTPFRLDYGKEESSATWIYSGENGDYPFWTRTPRRIPEIPSDLLAKCENNGRYGAGTCLSGRLWLHADTPLGSNAENDMGPNGMKVGFHGVELANHYLRAAPDEPVVTVYGGLRARDYYRMKVLWTPDPPWKLFEGATLPLIRDAGHLFGVFDDGHRENVDSIATDSLRAKLLDPNMLWVSPVEASPYVGGPSSPEALALSRDGTAVLSVATRVGGVLGEPSGGCDIHSDTCLPQLARTAAMSTNTPAPAAPSPRTNFVAVYSREQHRVFVIGGRDATTGTVTDEVWTYRLEDGLWDRLSLRGWLGDVVDATLSWRDGSLWVLAHDPTDATHRKTRLLRVEPALGDVHVIASATAPQPTPKYDFRGLFLDLDGNVGLFGSSERAQKHRIAVFTQRAGGYDVTMTLRRDRHLSAPPIVDARGVALYYEPDRPPVDPSKDPNDDPERGERTRPASRVRRLPLRPASILQMEDLLR